MRPRFKAAQPSLLAVLLFLLVELTLAQVLPPLAPYEPPPCLPPSCVVWDLA